MSSARPARLRVGVVGVGRVGGTLGAALARAGHEVTAVSAVSDRSLARAERLFPDAEVLPADELAGRVELVLLAVPDDVLRPLVDGIARVGAWRPGLLVAHTSGAQGIGVLDAAAARGVLALALHPVMTFTGRPEDLDRLTGATFGVTAPDELRPVAESLVVEMGGEPVWVPESARRQYHAALSIGSNHLVTLVNDAVSLLAGAGVADPQRLLAPLLSASLDNVLRLGDAALTGPVSRGDVATVAAHVATLRRVAPEQLDSYLALARRTAARALDSGRIGPDQLSALSEVLQ